MYGLTGFSWVFLCEKNIRKQRNPKTLVYCNVKSSNRNYSLDFNYYIHGANIWGRQPFTHTYLPN